ncbi:MAG: YibE/F family protein [Christensenellaceae bacterium]|nr:YibE/F family protein [Christensenellaceae bacterium]
MTDLKKIKNKKRTNWIICIVIGLLTILACYLPEYNVSVHGAKPRVAVEIISVDNSQLAPIGLSYTGDQGATVKILEGKHKGKVIEAHNMMLAALEKDKIFEVGDKAICVLNNYDGELRGQLIDHDRRMPQGLLFALFGVLLIVFGGVSGFGAIISLAASIVIIWKIFIPLILQGHDPILMSLILVVFLTVVIDILVAGISKISLVAIIGSLLGTFLTAILAIIFGEMFIMDGGTIPYVVPLLSQSALKLNIKDLFYSMVFIANSGALMDLSMDVAASCYEVKQHAPHVTHKQLLRSGMAVGRKVVGTMTTTLMLAYSGSYLSMLLFFVGQGTPVIDIINYKFVSAEILRTLVGSFGLVSVAPFTAVVAAFVLTKNTKEVAPVNLEDIEVEELLETLEK